LRTISYLAALGLVLASPLARAGDPPDAPAPVELPEIVVSAPGDAPPAPDPTASVTVIDAARVAGEAKELGALIATAPGVAVQDQGGLGRRATVSIRGSTPGQVRVFLDGLPLDAAAGGGVDLASIPSQWISRVEVVRGVAGARHGSGALGGMVNLVTAAPRAGAWSASATGGSFGTWRTDAQGAAAGERWGIMATGAASGTDGRFEFRHDPTPTLSGNGDTVTLTRSNNGSLIAGGLVKGFAELGANRLDALVQFSRERRDLPGWPYNLTPEDWQSESRALAALRWSRAASPGIVLSAGGYSRAGWLDARLEYLGGETVRQRGLAGGGDVGVRWTGAAGSLTGKAEASTEALRADGIGTRSRVTLAGVLDADLLLAGDRVRLAPAVRAERSGRFDALSAQLGGTLVIAGPLSLRANAGRSVRIPNFTELYLQQGLIEPNPSLQPEVGVGGDAGLVAEGALGRASAGAFATLYSDVIVYQPAPFRRLTPMNVDRALARGVEVEAATAPAPRLLGLAVTGAYTFIVTETLRGSDGVLGKDLPLRPRHRVYCRAEIGGAPAEAHAEMHWTSHQWLDLQNTRPIPAVVTVSAGGSVRLLRSPAVRVHLELRNLLDDLSHQDGFGNPLPGRTVLVTLRASAPAAKGEH
jgi:iron complex outermembrane receptor protein